MAEGIIGSIGKRFDRPKGFVNAVRGNPKKELVRDPAGSLRRQVRLRAGKEQTPEMVWRPPTEHIFLPNEKLKGMEQAEQRRFHETQLTSVRLLHDTARAATDEWRGANPARREDLRQNKSSGVALGVQKLFNASKTADGSFGEPIVFEKQITNADGTVVHYQNNDVVVDAGDSKKYTIREITGKQGGTFVCKVAEQSGTVQIPAGDVIRAQVVAEASTLRERLSTPDEQKIFDDYVAGLNEETDPFKFSDDDAGKAQREEFNKRITAVAKSKGMLTTDDAKQAIKSMTQSYSDTPPEANASEAEKRRWEERARLEKAITEGVNLFDASTFTSLFGKDLSADIAEMTANIARIKQEMSLGTGSPVELAAAERQLQLLNLVQNGIRDNTLASYFNGIQTGIVAGSSEIAEKIRSGKLAEAAGDIMPEAGEHLQAVDEAKADLQKRSEVAGRNRKIVFTSLGLLAAVGYFLATKAPGADE